jgi:hypothetical protein
MELIPSPLYTPRAFEVYLSGGLIDNQKDLAEQIADIGLWCLRQQSATIDAPNIAQIQNYNAGTQWIWFLLAYTLFLLPTAIGFIALYFSTSHAANYQLYQQTQVFPNWRQEFAILEAQGKSTIDHIVKGLQQFNHGKVMETILQHLACFNWIADALLKSDPVPEFLTPLLALNIRFFTEALYTHPPKDSELAYFKKLKSLLPFDHNDLFSKTNCFKQWESDMKTKVFVDAASMRAHIELGLELTSETTVSNAAAASPSFALLAGELEQSAEIPDYIGKLILDSEFTVKLYNSCSPESLKKVTARLCPAEVLDNFDTYDIPQLIPKRLVISQVIRNCLDNALCGNNEQTKNNGLDLLEQFYVAIGKEKIQSILQTGHCEQVLQQHKLNNPSQLDVAILIRGLQRD